MIALIGPDRLCKAKCGDDLYPFDELHLDEPCIMS